MASNETIRSSAILWLKNNTTLDLAGETALPPNVELFVEKYGEVMGLRAGVASESISGLSQSFSSTDVSALLRQYAQEIIGKECIKSDVKVFCALDSWVY